MEATIPTDKLGLVLRIGLYAFLAYIGLLVFYNVLAFAGPLLAATLGTFLAAAVANAITVRIFERGRLSDMGLAWDERSPRSIAFGVCCGILAAAIFVGPALLVGVATVQPDSEYPANWSSLVFLTCLLIFGAFGEEMLFRGYGFQTLVKGSGRFAALLP